MVFKSKIANETNRIGDTKVRRTFAWFPHQIKDEIVWLETYETLLYYTLTQYPVIGSVPPKVIDVYEWIKITDRVLPKLSVEIKSDKL
jgi:hypothetical protein